MDNIIDSAPGIPIGNYLSQYFGNVYLNVFDHWIKEIKNIKFYYRYVDDIVILNSSKENLKSLFSDIKDFLNKILNLKIKSNHQTFPVMSRGIDFVGYKFYHSHVLLRKKIKKCFVEAFKNQKVKSLPSYKGWAIHCNSRNLIKKLNQFNEIPKTLYAPSYC